MKHVLRFAQDDKLVAQDHELIAGDNKPGLLGVSCDVVKRKKFIEWFKSLKFRDLPEREICRLFIGFCVGFD